ncbi:hypothetical protein BDB01DRAFT_834511 [Pilobolus umbonatus]|nr:hypothetical protein BDB01DRAFT_834511 [Pilobolus umbonatus]
MLHYSRGEVNHDYNADGKYGELAIRVLKSESKHLGIHSVINCCKKCFLFIPKSKVIQRDSYWCVPAGIHLSTVTYGEKTNGNYGTKIKRTVDGNMVQLTCNLVIAFWVKISSQLPSAMMEILIVYKAIVRLNNVSKCPVYGNCNSQSYEFMPDSDRYQIPTFHPPHYDNPVHD